MPPAGTHTHHGPNYAVLRNFRKIPVDRDSIIPSVPYNPTPVL